jgi:uncharacterized membrane protein HdeD (DUF308 family)
VNTQPRVDGAPGSGALAASLGRAALVRGVVVGALAAYVVSQPGTSPAVLAKMVAVYWLFEGVLAFWMGRVAATLATSRGVLIVRGVIALIAGVVLLVLPLAAVFGEWRPGQGVLFLFTIVPALAVTALQILMAATVDMMLGVAVRRRIPGDWSVALGALASIVLGVMVAVGFAGLAGTLTRPLAIVALAVAVGLLVSAFRLWRTD